MKLNPETEENFNLLLRWVAGCGKDKIRTGEVATIFEWTLPTTRRYLGLLEKAEYLKAIYIRSTERHSGVWKVQRSNIPKSVIIESKSIDVKNPTASPDQAPVDKKRKVDMNPQVISRLAYKWSKDKWEPQVVTTIYQLPLALADLLDYVDNILLGEPQEQAIPAQLRVIFANVLSDIGNLQAVVEAIYRYDEMWENPVILTKAIKEDRLAHIVNTLRRTYRTGE